MTRPASLHRIVAAVLLPALVLFALAFSHDLMRCRLTGAVIEACACPIESPTSERHLQPETCCARDTVTKDDLTRTAEAAPALALPLGARVCRLATDRGTQPGPRLTRATDWHPTGPPLLLRKQSRLI